MPDSPFWNQPQPPKQPEPQPPTGQQTQTIPTECRDEKALVDKLTELKPDLIQKVSDLMDIYIAQAQQKLDACIAANGGGMLPPG